jgi:hypothetical protein
VGPESNTSLKIAAKHIKLMSSFSHTLPKVFWDVTDGENKSNNKQLMHVRQPEIESVWQCKHQVSIFSKSFTSQVGNYMGNNKYMGEVWVG